MNELYARESLPEGYAESEKIDLVKNKKQMLFVNGLAIVLTVLLIVLGVLIQPESAKEIFHFRSSSMTNVFQYLVIGLASIAYIVGHEAVHGIFMWLYSRKKPHFGFSFTYAYAGSDMYFAKKPYLVIAIAPLAFWTVMLAVLQLLIPAEWFWVVWFIQITNISGAAGDLFVFARMLKKPDSVLVQDSGTDMTVYLPQA